MIQTAPYQEQIAARGLDKNGNLFEVAWNPRTGTWTLMVTPAAHAGAICILVDGQRWDRNGAGIILRSDAHYQSIAITEDGAWSLTIFRLADGAVVPVTEGTDWEFLPILEGSST